VVRDRLLVTGQNPASSARLAVVAMEAARDAAAAREAAARAGRTPQ
jgi:hypothetical protein